MPLHQVTFLWVQQQEYERGMTHQEVERAARLAARRVVPSDREPILTPVAAPGGFGGLTRWIQKLSDTVSNLGHRWPRPDSTQAGSIGA